MLWLLSAMGWLRGAFRAALGIATRYPMQAALCAALLACAWCWHGWDVSEARRKSDAAAFQRVMDAGRANLAALKAAKAAEDTRQSANTRRIDDATQPARAAALAAADTYAAAHHCLRTPGPIAAASGEASGHLPGPAAAARGFETPASAVAVAPDAFNACTLNTRDLGLAYDWAQGLPKPSTSESPTP